MKSAYALKSNDDLVLSHAAWERWLLRDSDEGFDDLEIEAFAASGDCFEMLANDLDQIMLTMQSGSAERYRLDRVVEILLYLQEHHKIIRKN